MNDKQKAWELTPKVVAHCTGQRFPKDIYYRNNKKLIVRLNLSMPDGFLISVPIYESEPVEAKIKSYVDNWYIVTKRDPEKFEHFVIKDKCPKCGGELRAKIDKKKCFIWCINHPNCDYQICEEDKVRERMYEKYGLKTTCVHKTGGKVIFSNKPIEHKK
jgi:hypothetical protein